MLRRTLPPSRRLTLAGIVAANAIPVVGVLVLDWTVATVLALYWLETGVVIARGAIAGLFAGQPPANEPGSGSFFAELGEKRGTVRAHRSLPPLCPRNAPAVCGALWLVVFVWPLTGAALGLYVVDVDSLLAGGTVGPLALAALGALLANAIGLVEDVRSGAYVDRTVRAAIPREHVLALLVLVLAAGPLATPAAGATVAEATVLLVTVVAAKTLVDLGGFVAATDDRPLVTRLLATDAADESPRTPVPVPDGDPTDRVRADIGAARLRGVVFGLLLAPVPPSGLLVFGVTFLVWGFVGVVAALAVGVSLVAATVVARVLEQEVLFGHLEYRIYDEGVVAYDRLLDEPQWFVPSHDIVDTRTSDGLFGHRLGYGTGTVRLQCRDRDDTLLVFLPDAERVQATIGL
ncbi:DUF6498-containing protein [Haloarchaeobius baliensis]|uniref:DUF6498-containing protein n=1 Tax=Haloarchaeobius baliensis TaxID=1670458 RepID=UPI003F882706